MKMAWLAVLLFLVMPIKGGIMDARIVNGGAFRVIGVAIRTSNKVEMGSDGKIGKLWAEFLSGGLVDRIPGRADHNIVVLYYDYESDKDGPYTYMIGARVTSTGNVPSGMSEKDVPEQKYAVFTSERGPVAEVVQGVWRKIWTVERGHPGANRKYGVDYEVYDERSRNPADSQIDAYVSIEN
ncbi:MAG TPA: GyrI-like domain-containing protein [Blastocatellia bacterium]|nr:GyrI-like domain-containing protein [Blastocatellia bacterium]